MIIQGRVFSQGFIDCMTVRHVCPASFLQQTAAGRVLEVYQIIKNNQLKRVGRDANDLHQPLAVMQAQLDRFWFLEIQRNALVIAFLLRINKIDI